jgi:acyl-CoA synthetase (AMP-forming)/AMP-acid ligase II
MVKERHSRNFISNYLTSAALHNSAGEVAVYGDTRLTWKGLNDRANRLAQALIDRGVKKDDKVLIMLRNRPEFLVVNYAVQKCGAIPAPMNYRFTASEIEFQADHCDAVVFILEDIWLEQVLKANPNLKKIKEYICVGPECPSDMTSYELLLDKFPAKDPDVPTDGDDVCVITYTGGTTGFPKGVMLTYGAHLKLAEEFVVNLLTSISRTPLTPEFRRKAGKVTPVPGLGLALRLIGSSPVQWALSRPGTVNLLHKLVGTILADPGLTRALYFLNLKGIYPSWPFFHASGYILIMVKPLIANVAYLFPEEVSFNADKILAMIEKEKPVLLANVPTGWKMLVGHPDFDEYDVSSVVACISGGGLCDAKLKKKILRKFKGALFFDGLGQTEMTPLTCFRLDCSVDDVTERSVGKPMLETRIVDNDGKDVPRGATGEIIYKSNTIMKGYYKDEQKTAQVVKDGWLWSGDLGYFDEKGEIRVVDRKNECINTGAEKVFPLEVEQVILEHPAVLDVCVIGVPDEKWGSSVRAVVQLKEGKEATEEEIIMICQDKLASYKKPSSVVFVDDFPMSPVGKVLRSKIREQHGKP